jgi:hypothetical protein
MTARCKYCRAIITLPDYKATNGADDLCFPCYMRTLSNIAPNDAAKPGEPIMKARKN